eukprot:3300275-Amphidinium_carterae.1
MQSTCKLQRALPAGTAETPYQLFQQQWPRRARPAHERANARDFCCWFAGGGAESNFMPCTKPNCIPTPFPSFRSLQYSFCLVANCFYRQPFHH